MIAVQDLLAQSFFGSEAENYKDFVRPLQGNWFVPTVDKEEMISTWIGYGILSIEPKATSIQRQTVDGLKLTLRNCKCRIRVASVGPQAEEFVMSSMWWDDRTDIAKIWEQSLAQLMYTPRRINTYVYSEEGFNSSLTWTTDMDFMVWLCNTPVKEESWGNIVLVGDVRIPTLKE